MNIFHVIKEETKVVSSKAAIIEDNRVVSYATMINNAELICSTLKKEGVKPFYRVALLCDNSIDYIYVSLAILSLSAVVVPISTNCTKTEIDATLKRIDIEFLIYDRKLFHHEDASFLPSKTLYNTRLFINKRKPHNKPNKKYYSINPAFIRFSSGTTSISKGVVLSHESIVERTDAVNKCLKITHRDAIIWLLSMSYHFVSTIVLFLRKGATIILCHHQFPEILVKETRERLVVIGSPFHYDLIVHSDIVKPVTLKNFRLAISTAMKLLPETSNKFFKKFGFELSEAYGIIEVGLPFINIFPAEYKRYSLGKILPDYEVKLDGHGTDGVGEILIKGRGMVDAYFSPWQSREEILDDGWFRTGDLGKLDKDGFLTLVSRKKSVINFTGMKIFPLEVEHVLNQHPMVKESIVYGQDHPLYGQLPITKIVLKKEIDKKLDLLQDLRNFCYQRLESCKVPKEFIIVDQLLKTSSGKIKRLNSTNT